MGYAHHLNIFTDCDATQMLNNMARAMVSQRYECW